MKKITSLLTIFFLALGVGFAQDNSASQIESSDGAEITFESEVIDYGTIQKNADGLRTFKFTNTGTAPLIISNAKGSCGCTVPTWPRQPVNPGESAEIKVKYATNRVGPINKSVTVTSNANSATKVLRIKGEVVEKETVPVRKASEMSPVAD